MQNGQRNGVSENASVSEELQDLIDYAHLKPPFYDVIVRSLALMLIGTGLYLFLGISLPDDPEYWHEHTALYYLQPDIEKFKDLVNEHLCVSHSDRRDRLLFICYLSLYFGMWWAYFRSKYHDDQSTDEKRLRIQTLRRLLGMTSSQWKEQQETGFNQSVVSSYTSKSTASMSVIAIMVAVCLLVFDQTSSIWIRDHGELSSWEIITLGTGMLSAISASVVFMLCVDSLDTIFNRFTPNSARDILIKYFYDYTIDPRYFATAALMLSIILLLGFHSELLASVTIAILLRVGSGLWFPDLSKSDMFMRKYAAGSPQSCKAWYRLLLALPLAVYLAYIIHG